MNSPRSLILYILICVGFLAMAACAPGQNEVGAQGQPAQEGAASDPLQGEVTGNTVDVTPIPEDQLVPGQSEPGGSSAEPGAEGANEMPEDPSLPANTTVYTDNTYKFSVSHPDDYFLRTEPAEKLNLLSPKPEVSFVILSPEKFSSDIADLELADLEIRVYSTGQVDSLENWLTASGLSESGSTVKPFQKAHVSGLEICASTMLAPGCSYFVLGNGWIYQLIPASLEGESMMDTFTLIQ